MSITILNGPVPAFIRWVEALVVWLEVEFNGTEPGPPRSTSCQYARRWLIADVRASGWMILWWVSSDNVTEKTETPRRNERGNWILIGPAPYFLVGDVSRIYGIRKILRRHHWSKAHRYTSTWFFRHTPCILNINQSINQINLYSAPYKRGRRRLTIITCKCKSIA